MGYKRRSNLVVRIRDFYLKNMKWRRYDIGKEFHAGRNVKMWAKDYIKIGYLCYLGADTKIICNVEFGDYVFTANNVAFVGPYDHCFTEIGEPMLLASWIKDKDYNWKGKDLAVVVEDDVWFGFGSIILSGTRIGRGSIIAAGSVVAKDVEPYSIYAGVPAKKIRDRFDNSEDLKKHIELYNKKYKNQNS